MTYMELPRRQCSRWAPPAVVALGFGAVIFISLRGRTRWIAQVAAPVETLRQQFDSAIAALIATSAVYFVNPMVEVWDFHTGVNFSAPGEYDEYLAFVQRCAWSDARTVTEMTEHNRRSRPSSGPSPFHTPYAYLFDAVGPTTPLERAFSHKDECAKARIHAHVMCLCPCPCPCSYPCSCACACPCSCACSCAYSCSCSCSCMCAWPQAAPH